MSDMPTSAKLGMYIAGMCEVHKRIEDNPYPYLDELVNEIANLEQALDKRLRQEYMDEDHRLGGIGVSYEEFKRRALSGG